MLNSILHFEPCCEYATEIGFLLKLADCRSTVASTVAEASNWLRVDRHLDQGFDLVLLGAQLETAAGQLLMDEISQSNSLPVICLQRSQNDPPAYLNENVVTCQPEDLLLCLRECLAARVESTKRKKGGDAMSEVLQMTEEGKPAELDSMQGKYLTFMLAQEGYGLEIRYVTEIIGIQGVTNVPEMPEHVKGVLNLRGKVIPVIDVRMRFHLPERDYDDRTCIIVVDVAGYSVGLVVDKVSEVIDIPILDIEPAPMSDLTGGNAYIQGLGKVERQVIILLDIERLIKDEDLSEVEADAV